MQRIKWIANALIFIGATSIAVSTTFAQQAWPFALCDIGSLMWLGVAIKLSDRAFMTFNLFFVVIQTCAILMRIT